MDFGENSPFNLGGNVSDVTVLRTDFGSHSTFEWSTSWVWRVIFLYLYVSLYIYYTMLDCSLWPTEPTWLLFALFIFLLFFIVIFWTFLSNDRVSNECTGYVSITYVLFVTLWWRRPGAGDRKEHLLRRSYPPRGYERGSNNKRNGGANGIGNNRFGIGNSWPVIDVKLVLAANQV